MDIFKVPTCCSCHLSGYKEAFPPLASPSNSISSVPANRNKPDRPQPPQDFDAYSNLPPQQDYDVYSSSSNQNSQYSTVENENVDDDGEDENSNIAYQFGNGFKRLKPKNSIVVPDFTEPPKTRPLNKRFPDTFLTPPANNKNSNFPFTNRGPNRTPLQRTPLLKRKQFDQSAASTDSKISHVTAFPPKVFSQSERPKRITPPIKSTVDTTSVNLRLPNAQNSDPKRINYNYHPIIDFFEDEAPPKNNLDRKVGKLVADDNSWRPVIGG